MTVWTLVGLCAVATWLYLLSARGGFWRVRTQDDEASPPPASWPSVIAIVPARNEADLIARSVGSLLRQDYPGSFRVVVVDDGSSDGTAEAARQAATADGHPLEVISGAALPSGWTGKLWAQEQGIRHAVASGPTEYFLLTDADIEHASGTLRALVARAEGERRVLVSTMVELLCVSPAERFLVPAFVFFFQMLYPFAWVGRNGRTAAAAGGCMLVKRAALEAAGGIAAIRTEIIDDCALARRLKKQGPIWLGLTRRSRSLRPYGSLREIGQMVSRSAYAQLGYSPLVLAGTVVAMAVTYLAPPLLALFAHGPARWAGLGAWLLMALSFVPMLRFYRLSPVRALALPAIGAVYLAFTVQSAIDVWRGRGGYWKGRAQAIKEGA